jgi:hypothetical protein
MNKYRVYLISLGILCYLFIYPVIKIIGYLAALIAALVVYLLIMMFIFNILFTIAITSGISFSTALIMLFIAILSLFGGVLYNSSMLNRSIYKSR